MSQKLKIRISFLVGLIAWVLYVFFNIYTLMLQRYDMRENLAAVMPQIFLTIFIVATMTYYRYKITKAESINFIDLLWKVFITGLIATIISLGIQGFFIVFRDSQLSENPIAINFLYQIYSGVVIIYLVSTMVVWKRLILYQKSKNLIQLWNFFEYILYGSLLFDFFGYQLGDNNFNIALVFITGFSLVLSLNLKWIAYLNFKQKWKSILFILLSGIYLYHFLVNLNNFSVREVVIIDLMDRVFIVAILIFIFLYAVIAILVTLFNLPTSSVFERKLKEAVDFQKLSQAIPSGQSEDQTYGILLDSSMSAVFADAAWLEIRIGDTSEYFLRNLTGKEVKQIKKTVKGEAVRKIIDFDYVSLASGHQRMVGTLKTGAYKSVLALPIFIKSEQVGSLVLLQEVSEAFNREMVEIIKTFVSQASISLENALLLRDAIENERYKEQLNIAKNVQKSLLPEKLASNDYFEISAYSMAADEVGGDYYDLVKFDDQKYGLIIGDVSGKGTSAAFNMAQMKGVFRSLVQLDLTPPELIKKANLAIGSCLERSSFITASYYLIDTASGIIEFVRAGHCPTLIFCQKDQEARYLQTKGMGMGIMRNSEYDKYVEANTLGLSTEDILLLHTDGITEAMNASGEQYGEDRLRDALVRHASGCPKDIQQGIIDDLYTFLGEKKLDDDYTLVILKFR
ncbi:MAG: GAF domain-containing SpoIIE family protein phosphatase [Bacteroidota bacterium]